MKLIVNLIKKLFPEKRTPKYLSGKKLRDDTKVKKKKIKNYF